MKGTAFVALGLLAFVFSLGYLIYPQTSCCYGPEIRTKALLSDLVIAVKAYQLEYDRLPLDSFRADLNSDGFVFQEDGGDVEIVFDGSREGAEVLSVLIGENVAIGPMENANVREIVFIEPDISYEGRGIGVVFGDDDLPIKLLDGWGQPIRLILDGDTDRKIRHPDGGGGILKQSVLVWSDGSPKHEAGDGPWKNNVKSWE